jgi:FdhD protein
MRHPPQRAKATSVVEWTAGQRRRVLDDVAGEEPLEIRAAGVAISVTMRTPGDDFDLAAGFLYTEGIVARPEDIIQVGYGRGPDGDVSGNIVEVELRQGLSIDVARFQRHFFAASSCGICGKASIDAVRSRDLGPLPDRFSVAPERLTQLPLTLRSAQTIFGRTGGLHAAGLFDAGGALTLVREDIGRHNAVDKIIGEALRLGNLPLSNRILLVSGRGGFEIVQKTIAAGIPVLASISAPSSLAVQLARDAGLTLVGFLRERRFVVYSGERRLTLEPADPRRHEDAAGEGQHEHPTMAITSRR